eukprot:11186784-Lingulodinium_polyedra.AAC.1
MVIGASASDPVAHAINDTNRGRPGRGLGLRPPTNFASARGARAPQPRHARANQKKTRNVANAGRPC